jgi:DNA-binding CsgD family transcriptional regulator
VSAMPRLHAGDLTDAKERVESALTLARLMHLDQVEMTGLSTLSPILLASGEIDRAIEIAERDGALSEARGDSWHRGYQLDYLARAYWLRGAREQAEALAREAVVWGRAMTIDEGVAFAMEENPTPKPVPAVKSASYTELTSRQLEIARLIVNDLTNRQIADRLFLSERTVETHITNILNKLGLNSRVHLSRWIAELP